MIKRGACPADLSEESCCHTFRAAGITTYLENKGAIEGAQKIADLVANFPYTELPK